MTEATATPRARRLHLAWALFALIGLVFLGYVATRVADRGRFAMPYSTYGAGPDGVRALFELLGEEGIRVAPWTEDVGRLPAGSALVILGGCDHLGMRPLSRPERERLTAWVDAGGVLVVAGAGGFVTPELGASLRMRSFEECLDDPGLVSLLRAAEVEEADAGPPAALPPPALPPGAGEPFDKPEPDPFADPAATLDTLDEGTELPEPVWGVPALPPLVGLPLLGMRNAGAIELAPGADARVLASSGGKIGVVEIRRGEGRVLVVASASLLQNRDLLDHGGALLMARLLRHYAADRTVYFDEYHVGAGERRTTIRYLGQLGAVPLLLQLLFVLGLVLVARTRRFGGERPLEITPPSSTRAFVGGLAGLFRGAADRKGTLDILVRAALRDVAAAHRQAETEPAALAAALEGRGRTAAAAEVRRIAAIGAETPRAPGDLARASRSIDEAAQRAVRREP